MAILLLFTLYVNVQSQSQGLVPNDSLNNKKYIPSKRPTYKATDRYGDEFSNRKNISPFANKRPKTVKQEVKIDQSGKFYTIDEKLGEADYRPGTTMSYDQYKNVQRKQIVSNFYKQKAKEKEEKDPKSNRSLVPRIYMNPNLDRIFGGNYIDVKLNGSVLLDFGYQIQTTNNPIVPINQRSIGGFKFDQQIALNAQAKIGERLKIIINQDTKSQFDFDNNVKVEYNSLETDIIQKIEAGNVSMPINSSLITGAQNLFGIKAILKFGKLTTTSILATQRGRQDEVKIQGGAQTKDFSIRADQYEDNKHYFLSQFFRNNYELALGTMPQINSGVIVTRVEVWVTNRSNTTDQLRNVCALMDLGENNPFNTTAIQSNGVNLAANDANTLWKLISENAKDSLNGIRRADNTANLLAAPPYQLQNGNDFELVRNCRRLKDSDFKFHPQLGYISLNAPVLRDDVLSVSFTYSYRGKFYNVGELVEDYGRFGDKAAIFTKLLRPSTIRTNVPMWDLQMKNIYSLNSSGITRENFQLRVTYRDDQTQLNNPILKFGGRTEEDGGIEGKPLLQVVNLDRLNMSNDPQPDGNFDFVESSSNSVSPIQNVNPATQSLGSGAQIPTDPSNPSAGVSGSQTNINTNSVLQNNRINAITIDPQFGRIIFPVLEPFGKTMRRALGQDTTDRPEVLQKYVYGELYTKTKSDALQLSNKNKYFIVGRFQSTASDEIQLAGMNIPPGSVKVFSGSLPLLEGKDYTVDYNLGKVKIINPAFLMPGQDVRVTFEKADLFQVRQRGFYGTRWDYIMNKDIAFGGTLLTLNERPLVSRVAIGDEPVNNTMWGFDGTFKRESGLITKLVDALPVISTKEKSTIQASGEFASLIPSSPPLVNKSDGANFYIDDFENSQIPFSLENAPALNWKLGATPRGLEGKGYNVRDNVLPFGYNRARLAWYIIDPTFYRGVGGNVPAYLTPEEMQNKYIKGFFEKDIFPNFQPPQIQTYLPIFDLAYYPDERGPYNYNPTLTPNGKLTNPSNNFGAITRAVNNQDTDFDNANYQYIEFWMMDPFVQEDRRKIFNRPDLTNSGGKLQFHLGSISEDIIKDGRQAFEQGLPVPNNRPDALVEKTPWGWVTNQQFLTNTFSTQAGARVAQDIGLDGLNNNQELVDPSIKSAFLDNLPANLTAEARRAIEADPAGDDFKYYLGSDQDAAQTRIVERYKFFNGIENNSPDNTGGGTITASSYTIPDNEDINQNNTLNDVEEYFKYEIDLRKENMVVGRNYIVNATRAPILDDNGRRIDDVNWYLFRIPIREGFEKVGNIDNFKSIRFLRTVLTGWDEPVVLRTTKMQLVASQWRPFANDLSGKDLKLPIEPDDKVLTVSQVNYYENYSPGVNTSPYVLPPGMIQDKDLNSTILRYLNEHSLRLSVDGLADNDARAVFKNYNALNLINYNRIKMFVHAEADKTNTSNEDLRVFMRIGSDFTENYYEVEIPLQLSADYITSDPNVVWPKANWFDFNLEQLSDRKLTRDTTQNINKFQIFDAGYIPDSDGLLRQKVYIRGTPVYSNIQTIMIGIRNPKTSDGQPKSITIWANELRTVDFQKEAGWAATGRVNIKLADLGNVSATAKYTSAGFGGLEQKISQRMQENTTNYSANASLQMDKFIPMNNKIGIKLPLFISIDRTNISPKYDPTNPDVRLSKSLASKPDSVREAYERIVQDNTTKRSISFTNISKVKTKLGAKSYPFDIENVSATLAYSDIKRNNINLADYDSKNYRVGAGYNYAPKVPVLEPFKNVKGFLATPYFKLIKDINISFIPNIVSVRGDLDRTITRTQYSNGIIDGKQDILGIRPNYEKRFLFNRNFAVGWNLTKSLSFNYAATTNAIIDEPPGAIDETQNKFYDPARQQFRNGIVSREDSIINNLKKGGRIKTFSQSVRVNYKIPFDKFPLTNFISGDASYAASYTWNAGAVGIADTLGNNAQNTRDITLNARVDLLRFYGKSKFLAKANMPPPSSNAPKPPPTAADTSKKKPPPELNGLKGILRFLMMVQSVNATYQQTEGTVLPGYLGKTKYLGMDQGGDGSLYTNFFPFILGSQEQDLHQNAGFSNRYMSRAQSISNPVNKNRTDNITGRANIVPFRDFKIQVDAKISNSGSFQEIWHYNNTLDGGNFQSQNPFRTGNYSVSFIAITSHFVQDSANNKNEVFHQLEQNRKVIRDRLTDGNPEKSIRYDSNAQDVLIPSFLSAYGGVSPDKQALTSFPMIPLPNWRMDYAGITNVIPSLKKLFPSININHAYSSTYTVGSYASSQYYTNPRLLSMNTIRDVQYASVGDSNQNFRPINVVSQVSIVERFAPLIGITIRTKSNMSFTFRYNRDRTVTLNTGSNRQLTEQQNQDLTFSYGYTKSNLTLPFLYRGREIILKNDIQFRADFTFRESATIQRLLDGRNTVTLGTINVQFRPNISYQVNQRLNVQVYFQFQLNIPKNSSSFRQETTSFGVQVRYSLS